MDGTKKIKGNSQIQEEESGQTPDYKIKATGSHHSQHKHAYIVVVPDPHKSKGIARSQVVSVMRDAEAIIRLTLTIQSEGRQIRRLSFLN
jgi:hypothetical protein